MRRWQLIAVVLVIVGRPGDLVAQRLDLGVGGGYVFGGGVEDPGPSLPTSDVVGVVWPFRNWGLAGRWVEGPGEDLSEVPVASGDRTFLGSGHLRYFAVTVRRRHRLSDAVGLEVGAGLALRGQFAVIQVLPPPFGRLDRPNNFFGGLATEVFLTRRLRGPLWVEGGVTYDFNLETNHLQPLALVVWRF